MSKPDGQSCSASGTPRVGWGRPGMMGVMVRSSDVHRPATEPCVFCDIVAGETEAEVVFADDVAVGFLDRRPLFAGHTLVVPREHVVTLADLPVERRRTVLPAGAAIGGGNARSARLARHLRRQQQRRQSERRAPSRARRASHEGGRAEGFLLAATRVLGRRSRRHSGPSASSIANAIMKVLARRVCGRCHRHRHTGRGSHNVVTR